MKFKALLLRRMGWGQVFQNINGQGQDAPLKLEVGMVQGFLRGTQNGCLSAKSNERKKIK
jgi:hypothetical protein